MLSAFAGAAAAPVLLAMLLNLGPRSVARTLRTRALLSRFGRVGFLRLYPLLLGGYAAGYLLPGPSEAAVHTVGLARLGFRLRDLASLQLSDKLLGVASILVLVQPIAGAALLTVAVIVWWRTPFIEALAWLLLSNLLSVAMLWLCLQAVHAPLPPLACLKIFVAVACASVLPGRMGILETVFVLVAGRLGVAAAPALAAALLYHLSLVAPLVVAGVPALVEARA
jgi:hypothetical protein